jgi:hypothetical protein
MRTLIYKRTHIGDPDCQTGVFGNCDCMGSVRGHGFNAVIGIGGIGKESRDHRIAGKLTWIGIGAQKFHDPNCPNARGPQLRFRHFLYLGEHGPLLERDYPALASRMYDKNVRLLIHSSATMREHAVPKIFDLDGDVRKILRLAMAAPPSNRPGERDFRVTSVKCRPKLSHGRASEAPPDERGGNRYVRPTAIAPHLGSAEALEFGRYPAECAGGCRGPLNKSPRPSFCE